MIKKFKIKLIEFLIIYIVTYIVCLIPNICNLVKDYIRLEPFIYILFLLLSLYYWTLTILYNKNFNIFIIVYIVFLIINLFIKVPTENSVNTRFYLKEWIKLLFINRIVFINVIGNIILFIPLGYIINSLIKKAFITIISCIIIIVFVELIQYITKLGVFDLIDIILNTLGIILGIFIKRIELWMIKKNLDN